MASVNIVTSDRGWILERLASEITSRLDYVRHTDTPDPDADINYYITYSCWTGRVSRIEVAWFAHLEPLGEAHEKFFKTAAAMNHCLTQARVYEDLLRGRGIANVTTISPGVDLDRFTPRLNIGVVGRAYHTGRKGEHLIGQLVDMPEVAWHFTGTGWPGPALELPDDAMPQFYRDMDYILVPSLYEGGPMCVVEALACGTEVISSPVGWVPDFPHIEFETGNVDDLRRVLLDLYAKKNRLRDSVLDRTWDAWAKGHDELFQALVAKHPDVAHKGGRRVRAQAPRVRVGRAGLLMHGNEASSQGGPSVRVPRTAKELNRIEVRAEALAFNDTDLSRFDLVHTFNVWSPQSALRTLRQARRQGKPSVFSPIFLDLSERPFWDTELLDVFRTTQNPDAIDARLAELEQRWMHVRLNPAAAREPMGGYFAMVREMIQLADHAILLSAKERELLAAIGTKPESWSVVHNPSDNAAFKAADPALFTDTYGLKDFVLCVGRVEARKNQLMLAHALRGTGIPLVIIGHTPSKEYRELIERHGGETVHFLGRLQAGSDLLLSAFRAARVATLPSWSEGAPLAALEAGAAGAALVLSDRSSEPEYFGPFARYTNPADPRSIREAILEAYETPHAPEMREAQIAHVTANYSWATYTLKTKQAYEKVLAAKTAAPAAQPPRLVRAAEIASEPLQRIVFDITTSVNRRGRWTGIARVEMSLALEMAARDDVDVRFVHWDNKNRRFIDIPFSALRDGQLDDYREPESVAPEAVVEPGALFIVAGSGWMQNAVYAEGAIAFAQGIGAELTVVIHDLIPVLFPYWFNDEYVPVFERNMRAILANADRVVAISETTKQDVEGVLRRQLDMDLDVVTFREGDQIGAGESVAHVGPDQPPPALERFAGTEFIIAVGAIHARKNHKVLYDVWVRLAEQLGGRCPTLIIIGGVAWNGTELARSIKSDKRLRGKLVLLDDVDDAGLGWLYRNCLFTAYPSLYEGWGLPVCESLRYGKICLASNASSIQEIAPDVTDLLDPLDFAAWFTRIRFYVTSAEARRKREAAIRDSYRPTSWEDAAAELSRKLRLPIRPNRQKARYHLGATLSLAAGNNPRAHARGSWHISESWGTWSAGPTVGIEFMLPTRPVQDLVLAVKAKALPPPGRVLEVTVAAAGRNRATWAFQNHAAQIRFLSIDKEAVGPDGVLRIELTNSELFTVAQSTSAATDLRAVGIGVYAAILTETPRAADLRAALDPRNECDEPVRPGDYVSLVDGRRAPRMIGGEWQKSSAWGIWPDGPGAKLYALLDPLPSRGVRLQFTVRAVATAAAPLFASVSANGTEVGVWRFDDAGMVQRDIVIPPSVQAARQPVELSFVPDARCSPHERGCGQEERPVSLGLFDVTELTDGMPARPAAASVPVLEVGEAIRFRPGSQSRGEAPVASLLRRGWFGLESGGVWSRGHSSQLAFRLDRMPDSGVILYVSARTFGTKQAGPLRLTIDVNGRFAVDEVLSTDGETTVALDIPASAVEADGLVLLTLHNDRALAPSSVGKSKDDRLLGVQLAGIETESAFVVEPFRAYDVGIDSPMADAFHEGWHAPEPTGRWSKPGQGHIRCVVATTGQDSVTLHCAVRVYGAAHEGSVTVDVLSHGTPCATWTFHNDDNQGQVLTAPLHQVGEKSVLDLTFVRHGALSPASLGLGDDTRELGLWLGSFELLASDVGFVPIGQRIDLLGLGTDRSVLRGEWDKAAGWGCWPASEASALVLAVDPTARASSHLDIVLRPVATPARPQAVSVLVNGEEAEVWRFEGSEIETRRLALPADPQDRRPIEIRFVPATPPASPAELSIGRERSAFAVGLYDITVLPADAGPGRIGAIPTLSVDEDLAFNIGSAAKDGSRIQDFLQTGWFAVENTGVWTRGRSGTMAFGLRNHRPGTPLAMTLVMRAMGSKARPAEVSVLLDGTPLLAATFTDGDWRDLTVDIPADLVATDSRLCLGFETDKAVAPSSNGRSLDDRLLGLQIARLTISPGLRMEMGRLYTGSGDVRLADFCLDGWHSPEESGIWSNGGDGRVRAVLADPIEGKVVLTVALRVFGTEATGPAEVDLVGPDGEVLEPWVFRTDHIETRIAVVPIALTDGVPVLDVAFRRPGAISPSMLGVADDRSLGVWISSLEIAPHEASAEAMAPDPAEAGA